MEIGDGMKLKNWSNNNLFYEIMDGYVVTENLSEDLDSATVIIPHIASSKFEPYDLVSLYSSDNTIKSTWLIADVNYELISRHPDTLGNTNEIFNYTLNLMSVTKYLETVSLPSMAITNIGQNRSIKYYVEKVVNKYLIPALKKNLKLDLNQSNNLVVNIDDIPSDVISSEYTFQSPTLREYLDALFSKLGGIAKLEFSRVNGSYYYFNLSVFYLTKVTEHIDMKYINGLNGGQYGEEYVTALNHSMEGVIGQASVTEYQQFKSEDYLMDTTSACILLNQQPYDIEKIEILNAQVEFVVKLKVQYYVDGELRYDETVDGRIWFTDLVDSVEWATNYYNGHPMLNPTVGHVGIKIPLTALDITPNYVTKEIFDSLPQIENFYQTNGDVYLSNINNLQKNNTFFGNRGSNKIDGLLNFMTKQEFWWTNSDYEIIRIVSALAAIRWLMTNPTTLDFYDEDFNARWYIEPVGDFISSVYFNNGSYSGRGTSKFPDYNDIKFRITYKPYINARFEVEDGEQNSHHVVMQDNSTNALTDIGLYLAQSVEKNSKLGNKTLIATARIPPSIASDIYSLGQYYQKDNDRYIVSTIEKQFKSNETLVKFTLTKNFTNRNLNTLINREKRYFALAKDSIVERSEIVKKTYINIELADSVTTSIYSSNIKPLNGEKYSYLLFVSYVGNNNIASGIVQANTIIGGNAIIYSGSFMDNINYKIMPGENVTGGYAMQQYKYTDLNGEIATMQVNFIEEGTETDIEDMINQNAYQSESSLGSVITNIFKDQREKLTINFEYIFKSSDSRLKIGSHFTEALVKKTDIPIKVMYFYTDGTSVLGFTNSGIPDAFYLTDNVWFKNNDEDHIQAIIMLTENNEDVLIIYNPPRGIYLNCSIEDETY